jgi:hypothetical protein
LLAAITRSLARWQMAALRHGGSRTVASHVHPDRHLFRRAVWKAQPSSSRGELVQVERRSERESLFRRLTDGAAARRQR